MRRLNHNSKLFRLFLALGLSVFGSATLRGQTTGQAEVALQSYYSGGNAGSPLGTSGVSISTTQFLPGRGLFTTSIEGYASNGFRTGNVHASLLGYAKWGWHWDVTGGDFRFSSNLVENPFTNVYSPEIAARGFRLAMKRKDRAYQVFFGEESLLAGPRIPYRVLVPQKILGMSMQQKVGTRWDLGIRYLQLTTGADAYGREDRTSVASGRDFAKSTSLTLQSTFKLIDRGDGEGLKLYGEAGLGKASTFSPSSVSQEPLSFVAGPSWEAGKFTWRANYLRQGAMYLPLLGYFVGDRKGGYTESHLRPLPWVDVYGSYSAYSNNIDKNPELSTFHSSGYSAGSSFSLPLKFTVGGSLSSIDYRQFDPARHQDMPSANRQTSVNISRPIGRHSLRASIIDMKLDSNRQLQEQRFYEAGDTFSWKRFVIGGSARMQQSKSQDSRNTLFYHGSFSVNLKQLSAYANVEKGNDLVNKSIFSTNAISSVVAGVSAPLTREWILQFETFKNNLNTTLNPENVFLFGNAGHGLNTRLSASNQWSVYVRISKSFRWGKSIPSGSSIQQYAAARVPLVGTLHGFVTEESKTGSRPAPNVSISLDGDRTVVTDDTGHYIFNNVPEGFHEVAVNMEQLPTDYDPGQKTRDRLTVAPRGMARTDFSVTRLSFFSGRVIAPKDAEIDRIVIRLSGTKLYTTPEADGSFTFANLPEGVYDVILEEKSIPDGYRIASTPAVQVEVFSGTAQAIPVFAIEPRPAYQKPVREIQQQQPDGSEPVRIRIPGSKSIGNIGDDHEVN